MVVGFGFKTNELTVAEYRYVNTLVILQIPKHLHGIVKTEPISSYGHAHVHVYKLITTSCVESAYQGSVL